MTRRRRKSAPEPRPSGHTWVRGLIKEITLKALAVAAVLIAAYLITKGIA